MQSPKKSLMKEQDDGVSCQKPTKTYFSPHSPFYISMLTLF
jgi:hypothetical protein